MKTNLTSLLLATAASLMLGACSVTEWTEAEAPKHLTLDSSTMRVDLRFVPGSASLPAPEAARLRQMAATGAIGPADRVTVAAAGPPGLAAQRVAAVSAQLVHYGVAVEPIQIGELIPNRGLVEITRTLVTLPPCPNWSKPSGTDFSNRPSSNHGCATEVNLGMMVANPSDLARGRPLGPAAGQPVTAAVTRYMNDKVTPLPPAGGATPFTAAASGP